MANILFLFGFQGTLLGESNYILYPQTKDIESKKKISSANVEACSLPKLFDEEK